MEGAFRRGAVSVAVEGVPEGALRGSGLLQPTKIPTINPHPTRMEPNLTLLLLEALGAGLIFVGIIWWTMFSGRKNGELPEDDVEDKNKP